MTDVDGSLQGKVRDALFSGLPILAGLTFVAVTIKVFRVAHMETSTTVAIVSSADPVTLLKGVIVTLLPGFLAGMIALGIWQWVHSMPDSPIYHDDLLGSTDDPDSDGLTKENGKRVLYGPWAGLAAALLIIGFFTVPSIAYVLICLPVLAFLGMLLSGQLRDYWYAERFRRVRRAAIVLWVVLVITVLIIGYRNARSFAYVLIYLPVLAFLGMLLSGLFHDWYSKGLQLTRSALIAISSIVAVGAILYLAISPDVWLPMRDIKIASGQTILVGTTKLHHQVGAYVLNSNKTTVTLLLDSPRAVVTVKPSMIIPNSVICIGRQSGWRPLLLRPSQVLRLEKDYGSPYEICPRSS